MSFYRHVATAIASSAAAVACAFAGDEGAGYSVRDSIGIHMVESTAPAWNRDEAWSLAPSPRLRIGVLEGDPQHQLFRVTNALQLTDGTIVVANSGTYELRFYDAQGNFLRATGGEGGGPGEFGRIGSVWRFGSDSLMLFDGGNARMSVHDSRGQFGRTFRLEQVTRLPVPRGVFATGDVLAYWSATGEEPPPEGLSRIPRRYARYHPDGRFVDSLTLGPGVEFYMRMMDPQSSVSVSRPFARGPQVAVRGNRWYHGTSDRYEIEVWTIGGALERIIRRPIPNRPVTEEIVAERERLRRERRAASGQTGPTPFDDITYPEEMPAYGAILPDANDNLWVSYYRLPEETPLWAVFNPDGRWLGDVEVPPNGRLTDIGPDYVVGVWRDELDVEQVRVYQLLKN